MKQEFALERNTATMNFTINYCTTKTHILDSEGFERVINKYLNRIQTKDAHLNTHVIQGTATEEVEQQAKIFTSLFKLFLTFDAETIYREQPRFRTLLDDKEKLLEFVEGLYDYWRSLERYSIIYSGNNSVQGLQKTVFIEANSNFTNLVLELYRMVEEKLKGYENKVYRQLTAGCNASLVITDSDWDCPEIYKPLFDVQFIKQVMIYPPFITYPKRNTRKGLFEEVFENPLNNLDIDPNKFLVYPAKVGDSLAYIFFNIDFMAQGITLCNLFELATEEEVDSKKPDLMYVFGYEGDTENKAVFHHDKENDIMVGYLTYATDYDYFGYMKKMILTLHNIRMINQGYLPIHGAMVNVLMKDGSESNVVIMGDSGAGKSESLEAFRMIGDEYIKDMKIIFDDMGTFKIENGKVVGYGTEIGAFIRLDDLDTGYAYRSIGRSIFMNPDKINARVVQPVATYQEIMKGFEVDMFLYANNYEDGEELEFVTDEERAKEFFVLGRRKAKGTTAETGVVDSYFANPFGCVQRKNQNDILIDKYFDTLFKTSIKVGTIRTRLGIDGYEQKGPQLAATKLFEYIQNNK